MSPINVGVVGVGHLGKIHATLYKQVKEANLVGIYDVDKGKAQALATELNCRSFDNLDQLISESDALNIVTPTTTHFEIAQKALLNDKHIFLEKPLTRTEGEAHSLIQLAEKRKLNIQVGHIERFNPALQSLKKIEVKPVFIEVHRLASFNPRGTDVAVILDLMIHDLDLILYLVKSKPVKIDASGVGVVSKNIDIANARIEFENGCVANVTASRISAKKMRKMRIFQRNAYISLDFNDGVAEIFFISGDANWDFAKQAQGFSLGQFDTGSEKKEIKYTRMDRKETNPLKNELSSFVQSIQKKSRVAVTAEEGLQALKLANQVLLQIEKHQKRISV